MKANMEDKTKKPRPTNPIIGQARAQQWDANFESLATQQVMILDETSKQKLAGKAAFYVSIVGLVVSVVTLIAVLAK